MREPFDTQTSRAVIRNGRVTITQRPLSLMGRMTIAYAAALREAGTTMCDLELDFSPSGEKELSIRFLPEGSQTEEAVETILEWAELTGCGRVWLPDRLVELDCDLVPHPDDLEVAECPTCGVIPLEHLSMDDVARSRIRGLRPRICPVCSSRVPERRNADKQEAVTS